MADKKKLRIEEAGGGGEVQEPQVPDELVKKVAALEETIGKIVEVVNASSRTVNQHSEQLANLAAIFGQVNDELSKLTGELHRSLEANEKAHRYIIASVSEVHDSIPLVVDGRIKEYIEIEEEPAEAPVEEEKKED